MLNTLVRDELAPQRALDFTSSFVVVGNVLGHLPKDKLSSWLDADAKVYPLMRETVWDHDDRRPADGLESRRRVVPTDPDKEPLAGLTNSNGAAHNEMQTISFIRGTLWDEAGWSGMAFNPPSNDGEPPVLSLLFRNRTPAARIFARWRSELGSRDESNRLRIAIVRGVSKTAPHMYRVAIGSNPDACFSRMDTKRLTLIVRVCTMDPVSGDRLALFLDSYQLNGKFILDFGFPVGQQFVLSGECRLVMQHLVVREVWEIGPHDIDVAAVSKDDDPIVPDGRKDAPVLATLHMLQC